MATMLTKEQLEEIKARLELSQQGYMGAMINSARKDIPALIAEIERLQAELDKANRFINELTDGQGWGRGSEA